MLHQVEFTLVLPLISLGDLENINSTSKEIVIILFTYKMPGIKYGEINFTFEILEEIQDKFQLVPREQFWLDALKACDKEFGFNMCPKAGSQLGTKHTEEAKIKMSVALQGSKNVASKMNELQVEQAKVRASSGEMLKDIAKEFNVTAQALGQAIMGRTWKHLSTSSVKIGSRKGEQNVNAKLNWESVRSIRKQLKNNMPIKTIAKEIGVSRSTIENIKNGKIWKEEK